MASWARLTQTQYNDPGYNDGDGDRLFRRVTMPTPQYVHPYAQGGYVGGGDKEDGTEAWGACLGVLVCIMLLLLLAFTASYPVSYYYYPADQNSNMYRGYYHGCPGCWL
jgi:hypothetical protein